MAWVIRIEKGTNGYILQGKFGDSEIIQKEVIEIKDMGIEEGLAERKAMQELCWSLMDYFAVFNSKHDKYRLDIRVLDQEGKEIESD